MIALSSDQWIIWQWKMIHLNATILFTWLVMLVMVVGSWWITRKLSCDENISKWQNFLEVIVLAIQKQIQEIAPNPQRYIAFIGTLFLFIAMSNILGIVPGYRAPTASLSTTVALALVVFIAVPIYGIQQSGWKYYFQQYLKPTAMMLPFNIIGEISRTLALAIRLFGNVMSGEKIIAVLLSIVPLFFPIMMQLLGLLTGVIQAYIFAILAMVYIASAARVQKL